MVLNIDGTMGHKIKTRKHPRHGTYNALFSTRQTETQHNIPQENAITVFQPRLFNSLPKYQRDIESVKTEKFKLELDEFLELIPDKPKMPNYVTTAVLIL